MRTIPFSDTERDAAVQTVLFDLDGTLLDTAPDLGHALNVLLTERGHPALGAEVIRPVVSFGSVGLLRLGFGIEDTHPEFPALRQRLLALYRERLAVDTRPFPGIDRVLAWLEETGIQWGVVTNKPSWLTDPLMRALNLYDKARCIVSGDTITKRKPEPDPLWHACALVGNDPAQCVYVGDAERDVRAGRRGGLKTLVALYGYIGADEDPESWSADGLLQRPEDLIGWLNHDRLRRPTAS